MVLNNLPVLKDCLKIEKKGRDFRLLEGRSAETSGGLLVCLPKE